MHTSGKTATVPGLPVSFYFMKFFKHTHELSSCGVTPADINIIIHSSKVPCEFKHFTNLTCTEAIKIVVNKKVRM